jgi:hypothetical protein
VEQPLTIESPVAEAPDARSTEPASEPTDNPALVPGGFRARSLADVLGDLSGSAGASPVSNEASPTDPPPAAPTEEGESGAPAPSKPSEPAGAPGTPPDGDSRPPSAEATPAEGADKPLSRRGAAARITELEAELTRLKTEAPPDPTAEREQLVAQIKAEVHREIEDEQARKAAEASSGAEREAIIERERRYRVLRDRPMGTLSAEDFTFVEEERERREKYPELQRHYETVLEAERAGLSEAAQAEVARQQATFWDSVKADLASAKDIPGVDLDEVKKAPSFADRDRIVYAAGAAQRETAVRAELEPRIADLQARLDEAEAHLKELNFVGPNGLGAGRAPVVGGRSSADHPPTTFDPSRSGRENLVAAINGSA